MITLDVLRPLFAGKRTVIAFEADADHVLVLGIFHGGQDHESESFEEPGTQDPSAP